MTAFTIVYTVRYGILSYNCNETSWRFWATVSFIISDAVSPQISTILFRFTMFKEMMWQGVCMYKSIMNPKVLTTVNKQLQSFCTRHNRDWGQPQGTIIPWLQRCMSYDQFDWRCEICPRKHSRKTHKNRRRLNWRFVASLTSWSHSPRLHFATRKIYAGRNCYSMW